jgi:hypothetical protein
MEPLKHESYHSSCKGRASDTESSRHGLKQMVTINVQEEDPFYNGQAAQNSLICAKGLRRRSLPTDTASTSHAVVR